MAEYSDNLNLQDFRNYCRLCFEQSSQLENLLAKSSEHILVGKIADCVNVSILPEDSPATSICRRCLALVEQFHQFKEMCKKHEYTFQTSIRFKSSDGMDPTDTAMATVQIKLEPPDGFLEEPPQIKLELPDELIDQLPLEITNNSIKPDSDCETQSESADSKDEDDDEFVTSGKRGKRGKYKKTERKLLVRLLHNGFLMNCKAIKLSGVMQWICRNSACRMSFTATVDWNITLHSAKVHNHYPFVDRTGMIQDADTGMLQRFAVSSFTGKEVLVWNNYEWLLGDKRKGDRKAVCKENKGKCKKHVLIKGDYESLRVFGEHNHPESYILYRDDDNPDENELNPWDLFVQINPCGLPIGTDWDMNRRVKLFHNRYQYRLMDCTWNGTSRWACDMVNCPVFTQMDADEKVSPVEHNHEPLASGIFNRFFYSVVRANTKCLKLCFNGHCYGSRDSNHWVCTTSGCYVKLYVGNDYQSFAEKGHHKHDGFSVVVKPLVKNAVFLTTQNPCLPDSLTIEDLHEPLASTSGGSTDPKSTLAIKKPESTQKTIKLRETVNGSMRMIYDGYRYSLWDLFPDGTTYWCCWGIRCKKSVHMTPQGMIYSKNESHQHQHPPQVTKIDQITRENGEKEWYAIFKDLLHNTVLVYRNTLWDLVLGEQCYFATCQRCEAKITITENFTKFAQSKECSNHDDKMVLIRVSAKPMEGDPIMWEIFKEKFPLRSTDGTIFTKGRHSQMFVGGFRYTMVGFTWTGGEMWRCSIQRCPARCKIAEPRGDFKTPVHNHDEQVLLQSEIWSEARQRQECYFVLITLKKTIATLYYNTYCYALKDKQQNVWSCFPGPCHALLRIEGDFERVVEEMEHSHDGTLTFIRSDVTYASQKCYLPTIGTSKKRPREESDSSTAEVDPLSLLNVTLDAPTSEQLSYFKEEADDSLMEVDPLSQPEEASSSSSSSTVNASPKLQEIINALVQPGPKNEQTLQSEPILYYCGGHTYNRSTIQKDGRTRLECHKPRCPGRVVIGDDQVPHVKDAHTHVKTYDGIGSICDYNNQYYQYILVNGSQRRNTIYFVCDGFRYNVQTKASDDDTNVVWQCNICPVKATVTESYSLIQFSGPHTHESYDIILPGDDTSDSIADDSQNGDGLANSKHLDEVIWEQHRYNKPIFIRRLNTSKWRCFRTRECKAHIYRNAKGVFKESEPHDHEGPVECCGEARFDPTMALKERFAILKAYGKSKLRHLIFQNQIYVERNVCVWECINKSCNAQVNVYDNFDFIQSVGVHAHQPAMILILLPNEVQRQTATSDMRSDRSDASVIYHHLS